MTLIMLSYDTYCLPLDATREEEKVRTRFFPIQKPEFRFLFLFKSL
jgi:hypothetical protein